MSATLRFATGTLRCSGLAGSKKTRCAQTVFCPDPPNPPLLGAFTRGQTGADSGAGSAVALLGSPSLRWAGSRSGGGADSNSGSGNVASLCSPSGAGSPSPQPSPEQRAREQREDDHAPSKKAEWSKWLHEQAGLEAVGKRAVEPGASRHRHKGQSRLGQAERSAGPSERSARLRTPGNFIWWAFFIARKESYPPLGRRSEKQTQMCVPAGGHHEGRRRRAGRRMTVAISHLGPTRITSNYCFCR